MKECRECDFFDGYDYSDGTPICECDGGYEKCPYNDVPGVKETGFKIEIDTDFLSDYIRHTLMNAIDGNAINIANIEVKKIIDDTLRAEVKEATSAAIKETVDKQVADYMAGDITIGGGWCNAERTLSREQYMAEIIQTELDKRFKGDVLKNEAGKMVASAIDKFTHGLRDDINKSVKLCFDAATRQALTDNVVSMLMANDTYKRLSDSMNSFLPEASKK